MIEVLFHGKRIDNGEWVEGYLCKKYFQNPPHNRFVIQYKTEYNPEMGQPDYMVAEVDPETVGRYTGFTDKNRKKIFEVDIVRYSIKILNTVVHEQVLKIIFKKGSFCMEEMNGVAHPLFHNTESTIMEIIGNIHDNPELMGVKYM